MRMRCLSILRCLYHDRASTPFWKLPSAGADGDVGQAPADLGTLVRRIPTASSVQYVHVPRFFADARTQGNLVRDAVVVHGLSSPEQVRHGRTLFN